ncbi:hypothetical protein F3Y22_tig00110647pilonHSYRG00076 [Hibiscus syriacus]|uniref:Pectinesterase inhibitor domain-containing protein n=1 Tax=Hibiscus syriacus TaxID=106335 RepID=A0A6A2ZXG4_HIBSY|nr:hypothetical protein F3Y22_tig00110647pilonHSYRG00076 [Hibiscus syriacus]
MGHPRFQLHDEGYHVHLQHSSRQERLFANKRPSSSTMLSSKVHHLQHNSRLEGLSANKSPSSSTTLSSKHNSRLEGLSANQRPSSSTTLSSKAHHLQHNSRLEGLSANKRPSSSTTFSSKALHLQHNSRQEGLFANKRPSNQVKSVYFAIALQEAKKLKDETEKREEKMTNSKKAIRFICELTKFKEACEESMVKSNTTDPKALIRAEFKATVAEIKNVMTNSKNVQDLQKDEKTKKCFSVYHELFDWAVVDLERSFDKLGEQDMTKIGDVLLTLQVWLSGALTSQETCVDSYAGMDSHATKKIQEIIAKSQELHERHC